MEAVSSPYQRMPDWDKRQGESGLSPPVAEMKQGLLADAGRFRKAKDAASDFQSKQRLFIRRGIFMPPYTTGLPRPTNRDTINSTRNTKNKIFAIDTAVPAMPPNPNIAAIIAMTKNVIAQPIIFSSFLQFRFCI